MTYKTYLVVNEILETEQSYVSHLKEIVVEYLDYWRHKSILSNETCNNLFGNITEIYEFSRIFFNELVSTNKDVSQIAHCFLNNRLKFIIYSTYCINFQNSSAILSEISQTNIVRQRQKELGHRLPLGSYLVLPIQHILRYHLLLKKLAAYTADNLVDHALAVKAYNKMVVLTKIIDETKNNYERGDRVRQIRLMIKRWKNKTNVDLYSNCFELYAEGDLLIAGTKKKVHLIALNNVLLIAREQKCGQLEYKAHFLNRNVNVIDNVNGNLLSFRLVSKTESKYSCTLQASFVEEKIYWLKTLKDMKEDTLELSKTEFAELTAEYFYTPITTELNTLSGLLKYSF